MDILETHIDTASLSFAENRDRLQALVDDLRGKIAAARRGGSEKAHARHREQGKLFVRERIRRLLDPGTPFL
jgi:3-methylcrotonyl-CoA carboxylase beta subunit